MEDRIKSIVNEIKDKNGKEWVGLQNTTEKQLESLMWYLEHPRLLHEMPVLAEELIELYDDAIRKYSVALFGSLPSAE